MILKKYFVILFVIGIWSTACDPIEVTPPQIVAPATEADVSQPVVETQASSPSTTPIPSATFTPAPTSSPAPTNTFTPTFTFTPSITPTGSETAHLPELPAGGVYAQVTEVHDGDTIWVRIDGDSFKVRYIGMNAPEIGDNLQPFGNEATDYNRQLVENQTVYLVQDVSDTDQYGRLLRYVFVGDTFVNAELVRVGLARAKNYPPDTAYSDFLFSMQAAAKAARLNIWSQ